MKINMIQSYYELHIHGIEWNKKKIPKSPETIPLNFCDDTVIDKMLRRKML
jgi:hypothetical protein